MLLPPVDQAIEASILLDTESSKAQVSEGSNNGWESTLPRNNIVASKRPCDVCRKRKIKCIPFNLEPDATPKEGERCRGCENLDVRCSHDYVNKKPGRPLGSTKKLKEEKERGSTKATSSQDRGIKDESGGSEGDPSEMVAAIGGPGLTLPEWHLPGQDVLRSAEVPDDPALTPDFGRETFHASPFTQNIDIRPSYSDGHPTPSSFPSKISPGMSRDDDGRSRAPALMDLWPAGLDKSATSSVVDAQSPFQDFAGSRQGRDARYNTVNTYGDHFARNRSNFPGDSSYTHNTERGLKRKASHGPGDDLLSPGRSVSSYTGGHNNDENNYSMDNRRRSFSRRSSMSITRLIQPDQQRTINGDGGANTTAHDFTSGTAGNDHRRNDSGSVARYGHPPHRDSFTSHRSDAAIDPNLEPGLDAESLYMNFPHFQFTHPPQTQSPSLQIELVTTWVNIEFFIGLYLKHQHALVPLVHKPTFRADLLERRDRADPEFRALLLSLVAYVICQVPVHRMTGDSGYTKGDLEMLQSQCHYASKVIQAEVRKARWEKSEEPSLTTLTILVIDYFYSQNCNDLTGAATTLGEAARLAYLKKLHRKEWKNDDGSYNLVEDEIRKRIFWQLYNTDKTDACSDLPVMLHDFEGIPPYPLCVDDDNITPHGMIQQLASKPSYMRGFVALATLFQVLGECLLLSRQHLARRPDTDVRTMAAWIEKSRRDIDEALERLPDVLRPSASHDPSKDSNEVFAVQRVNLMITAVFVKFELFKFKAELGTPIETVDEERTEESRKMCLLLHATSIDHIAMNGEAMRNKLVRIMLALSHETDFWNEQVKHWWDIYAHVQFVQVIPESKQNVSV